jgi:FKBP-type peptidyl-prolyl cis-trans isomerase FklB
VHIARRYGPAEQLRHGGQQQQIMEHSTNMKMKVLTPLAALAVGATLYASTSPSTPTASATAKVSASPTTAPGDPTPFKDQRERASYSLGMTIGEDMKRQSLDLDADTLMAGFKAAFTGDKLLLTDEQRRETLTAFQRDVTARAMAEHKAVAEKNKKAGEEFLAANKTKDGVKALPSGLQYKVLAEGKGAQPKLTDQVTVNYKGTLIDGTEFDSSYKRGEPATFPVSEVIKAWTEVLPLMKTGAKWQLFVPAELAYGERGAGKDIPPNATLIFEVELLAVKAT